MRAFVPLAIAAALLAVGCQSGGNDSTTPPAKPSEPATPDTGATASTFADVQPILTKSCSGCHGAQPKEGYDLRTYESVMKGGNDGPLVKAGDPAGSLIVHVIRGHEGHPKMPPGSPLTEDEIKKIEAWIRAGAKS